MDGQFLLTLLHEVGPTWACIVLFGVWCWRCTPWAGKQLEKLIDEWIAERKAKRDSTEAK